MLIMQLLPIDVDARNVLPILALCLPKCLPKVGGNEIAVIGFDQRCSLPRGFGTYKATSIRAWCSSFKCSRPVEQGGASIRLAPDGLGNDEWRLMRCLT